MVAIGLPRFSKCIQPVRHGNLTMLCSKAQFDFHLLDKALAADRDRLRPAIISRHRISAQRGFDPLTMCFLKFRNLVETAKCTQRCKIDDAIALGRILDLQIPAVLALCGMLYKTGTHHVEINVHEATMQMCAGLDGGGVIAVLSKRTQTCFSPVVLLRGPPSDQLHAAGNNPFSCVLYQ